jgi:hypothetical protein
MHDFVRKLAPVFLGVSIGVAFVLSCDDDDSVRDAGADAAKDCNCPAAEPPLKGRITYVEAETPLTVGNTSISANCAPGSFPIGGGCRLKMAVGQTVFLQGFPTSGTPANPESGGFLCQTGNGNNPNNDIIIATAVCLKIAP